MVLMELDVKTQQDVCFSLYMDTLLKVNCPTAQQHIIQKCKNLFFTEIQWIILKESFRRNQLGEIVQKESFRRNR